jgi:hypothetical protein
MIKLSNEITNVGKSKEYTSSGTSKLHFGHFKASCNVTQLLNLDKWFIELLLRLDCSLKRWHRVIDVMIPKKQDSIKVNKLRTIVLMEPDFNFMNKIIGRRVMQQEENAGSIVPEQIAAGKGKTQ